MTSLYEQIGGRAAVDAAVNLFYRKILADSTVNHLFTNTNVDHQIAKQKAFLTYAFGGNTTYSGKNMREAHKHLNISEEHFQAVAGHLKTTLEDLSVPENLQDEIMAIAANTHNDVLNL